MTEPAYLAVIRVPIEHMPSIDAAKAYVAHELSLTSLQAESVEIDLPDGPASLEMDEC